MDVAETRYGKLIASRKDLYLGRSLFEYGEFSEQEVELFRTLITKEMIVCDVGANIGAHTLAFSRLAGYVHAFEPNPYLFNALAGMVALNELKNVSIFHCGIGEKLSVMATMDLLTDDINNLGAHHLEPSNGRTDVMVYPLDTKCHFLKIDVEGMELDVLKGAQKMIEECQPIIYMENDRENKADEVIRQIKSYGYTPYWHTPLIFNPDNFYKNETDVFGDNLCSINMLCVPKGSAQLNGIPAKEGDFYPMFRAHLRTNP